MASKKYVLAVYNNKIKEDYLKMTPFAEFISISANSDGIYQEVEDCLSNENKKEYKINKAYTWVKTQTWEKMVETYLKLWQKPL